MYIYSLHLSRLGTAFFNELTVLRFESRQCDIFLNKSILSRQLHVHISHLVLLFLLLTLSR